MELSSCHSFHGTRGVGLLPEGSRVQLHAQLCKLSLRPGPAAYFASCRFTRSAAASTHSRRCP